MCPAPPLDDTPRVLATPPAAPAGAGSSRRWASRCAVLLVTGSVSAFVAYQKLNGNITQENVDNLIGGDRPTKVEVPDDPQEPLNILLMGSDKRSGKAARTRNVAGQRSDTTILLHLAADRQSAVLVSIPRDTMVPIPSCKRQRRHRGAARRRSRCSTRRSPRPARPAPSRPSRSSPTSGSTTTSSSTSAASRTWSTPSAASRSACRRTSTTRSRTWCLTQGIHTVKGQQALAYVRTRHALGNGGDLARIDRQQAFLGSMVTKVKSKGLLLRPDRLLSFLGAATNSHHHRPRPGQPQRAAQAGPGRQGHRHQGRHLPHRAQRAMPRRPEPGAAQAAGRRRCGRSLRFDRPLPGKEPKQARRATATAERAAAGHPAGEHQRRGAQRLRRHRRRQQPGRASCRPAGSTWSGVGNADRPTTRRRRCCTTRRTTSPGAPWARHHRLDGQ